MKTKHLTLVLFLFTAQSVFAANSYQIQGIPYPAGASGVYNPSINSSQQVAFNSYTFEYDPTTLQSLGTPYLWSQGQLTPLPIGSNGLAGYVSEINDAGVVVGNVSTPGSYQPVVWSNGSMTSLPLGGMAQGQALAINDQNEVVGSVSDFSGDVQQAVLWSNGILSNLGINGTAALINNQSQILIEQNIGSLLLYDNGQMTPATALSNSVYAINDTGQFVRSSVGSVSIWQDGNEYFLPNLPGTIRTTPWGINDASQVVGYSNLGDGRDVATLWQNGSVFDLNNLIDPGNGWILNDATDIAQDGSIVGTGSFEGQPEIFILTPTAPEPATLGIIGAGAFLITRRRRGGSITS